jgi:hypothetical protein
LAASMNTTTVTENLDRYGLLQLWVSLLRTLLHYCTDHRTNRSVRVWRAAHLNAKIPSTQIDSAGSESGPHREHGSPIGETQSEGLAAVQTQGSNGWKRRDSIRDTLNTKWKNGLPIRR